jgi:hypothetical protein
MGSMGFRSRTASTFCKAPLKKSSSSVFGYFRMIRDKPRIGSYDTESNQTQFPSTDVFGKVLWGYSGNLGVCTKSSSCAVPAISASCSVKGIPFTYLIFFGLVGPTRYRVFFIDH